MTQIAPSLSSEPQPAEINDSNDYPLDKQDSENLESEEKKFNCPHCDHKFTRKHNLKSHLLIHTKEKPFSCSICSSKFRRLHDLKRHEKLHTGEKPYQCKNCGRKFARCDALVRHNNSQSGCTLLVDDSILKHRLDEDLTPSEDQPVLKRIDSTWKSQSQILSPQPQPQPQPPSELTPQPQLHPLHQHLPQHLPQQVHQLQQPQPQTQPLIERSNSTHHISSHLLPSINKLTPLMNSERANNSDYFESNASSIKNYDLLPYVKLLESRVSTLETKLSTTETKLAQLVYQIQNNE